MVVNLINMPLTFLSGVFYLVTTMPDLMKAFSMVNPLTYCVHASRYWLTGADVGFDYMNPLIDLTILSAFTAAMLAIAIRMFEIERRACFPKNKLFQVPQKIGNITSSTSHGLSNPDNNLSRLHNCYILTYSLFSTVGGSVACSSQPRK